MTNMSDLPRAFRRRVTVVALSVATVLSAPASAGDSLREFLADKEATLRDLRDRAADAHKNRCHVSTDSCDVAACGSTFPPEEFGCGKGFGFCSRARSTVSFAPQTSFSSSQTRAFLKGSRVLDKIFAKNLKNKKVGGWQYVTDIDGTTRRLPGAPDYRSHGKCGSFDGRLRPWYAAAASGPKDVVMILDTSGSMATGGFFGSYSRLDSLKNTVLALLDTLSPNDYVGIVEFSSDAHYVGSSVMQRATPRVVARLGQAVRKLRPRFFTAMSLGLELGFNMLRDSSRSSGCTKVVQFLTDGHSTEFFGEQKALKAARAGQAGLKGNEAHIFTYSMGKGAGRRIEQRLACDNRGVWMPIREGQNPLDSMGQYFRLLASGIHNTVPRWTNPYVDKGGLGRIVTATLPYYDFSHSKPLLAGVVSIDVLIAELKGYGSEEDILRALSERSAECASTDLSSCHLQHLRAPTGYTCPSYPSTTHCPGGSHEFIIPQCPGNGDVNEELCERLEPVSRVAKANKTMDNIVSQCAAVSQPRAAAAPTEDEGGKGPNTAAIVLGIFAALLAVALVAVGAFLVYKCWWLPKQCRAKEPHPSGPY